MRRETLVAIIERQLARTRPELSEGERLELAEVSVDMLDDDPGDA